MNYNIIDKLIEEARNSVIEHQLSAAIIKNNKLLTKPCCNIPINKSYNKSCSTIHAEINAILRYGLRPQGLYGSGNKLIMNKKNKKIDVIVIRINKINEMCNARSCFHCLKTMKELGIRRVYYSINSNEIIYENIKDMFSIQITAFNKSLSRFNKSFNIVKFYESILIKNFPQEIKTTNLINFINYNFYNIFPNYKIIINKNIVIINNSNNDTIITALII